MPGYIHRQNSIAINRKMPFQKSFSQAGSSFACSLAEGVYPYVVRDPTELRGVRNNVLEGRPLGESQPQAGGNPNANTPSPFGHAMSTNWTSFQLSTDARTSNERDRVKYASKDDYQVGVSFWAKMDVYSWRAPILGYNTYNYAGWGFVPNNFGSGNVLCFNISDVNTHIATIPFPSLGDWHHIAGSYNRHTQRLRIWCDGIEGTEKTTNRALSYAAAGAMYMGVFYVNTYPQPTYELANVIINEGQSFTHSDVQMMYQGSSNLFKNQPITPIVVGTLPRPLTGISNLQGNLQGNLIGGFQS